MIISDDLNKSIRHQLPKAWAEKLSDNVIALIAIEMGYLKINMKNKKADCNYTLYGDDEYRFVLRKDR